MEALLGRCFDVQDLAHVLSELEDRRKTFRPPDWPLFCAEILSARL